jgi:thiol-disulfide isomerase/thioredoxin
MKRLKMKIALLFLLLVLQMTSGMAKPPLDSVIYPEVGKPMPDFILHNVEYYPRKQVKGKDFRGKWLFLDLWDRHCAGCIAVFPKYNDLQKKLGSKIQFVLVGRPDRSNRTQSLYEVFKNKEQLQLPCAFDGGFFTHYDINNSPYLIVIDPKGVVRGLTTFLTEQDIKEFLVGKYPSLQRAYREHEKHVKLAFDPQVPLLVNANGGDDTDFLFRSMLVKYNPLLRVSFPVKIKDEDSINLASETQSMYGKEQSISIVNRKFEVIGASIDELYNYAYFGGLRGPSFGDSLYGRVWPRAVFQVTDSSLLRTDDYFSDKNRFCYSLILPASIDTRGRRMKFMQQDLLNYFGYVGKFVIMKMPYWRLVATDEARIKLKTKGDTPYSPVSDHEQHFSVLLKNQSISYLIYEYLPTHTNSMPFYNETGIQGNIDITLNFNTMLSNFWEIRQAFEKNGLDLVEGEKEMQVLVITEIE